MHTTTSHSTTRSTTVQQLTTLTHATEHQDRNAYLATLATCHTAHIPDTDIHTAWHTA